MLFHNKKIRLGFQFLLFPFLGLLLLTVEAEPSQQYPPGEWDTIIENRDFTSPFSLEDGQNNVLITGSTFHDFEGDAITLGNVSNIYIKDCVIYGISGNGIVLRSTKKTANVTIDGCEIHDTTRNGIIAKQDDAEDIDHTQLVIKNNTLYNNGTDELDHSIYVQSQDTKVLNNVIHHSSGNGISIRSSGLVSGNQIWDTHKSCIRYFSDNVKGPSNTLLIENNICYLKLAGERSPAISLLWSPDGSPDWIVDNYVIRFNTVAVFTGQRPGIAVESEELNDKDIAVYGNIVINTRSLESTIHQEYIDYFSSNYISTVLDGFKNGQNAPYDFRLMDNSPAIDFANEEIDFPRADADGALRASGDLDAGAYQLARSIDPTSISVATSTTTSTATDSRRNFTGFVVVVVLIALGLLSINLLRNQKPPSQGTDKTNDTSS